MPYRLNGSGGVEGFRGFTFLGLLGRRALTAIEQLLDGNLILFTGKFGETHTRTPCSCVFSLAAPSPTLFFLRHADHVRCSVLLLQQQLGVVAAIRLDLSLDDVRYRTGIDTNVSGVSGHVQPPLLLEASTQLTAGRFDLRIQFPSQYRLLDRD